MSLPNPLIAQVVPRSTPPQGQAAIQLSLFSPSGSPLNVGSQIATNADAAAATSTAAAGATPTKAEFDALRTDYLALRTAFNALQAKARTAGILAP